MTPMCHTYTNNILYCKFTNLNEMMSTLDMLVNTGWQFVCYPFTSDFVLEDTTEDSTAQVPTAWSVVLHRF